MEELKNVIEFNTPDDEEFKAFVSENITENLNHARHIETEIHTFTGIYMAVVAGVLAFDFSGRQGVGFGVMVHMVLLLGGLLAILLLNRWYTGFDTHMASAECLSYLKEKLILHEISTGEALALWRAFADEYRRVSAPKEDEAKAVEKEIADYKEKTNSKKRPKAKDLAFSKLILPRDENFKTANRLFAFKIPNRSPVSTRDYVYGFHGVILISVLIIIIRDLYGMII